MRDEKPGDGGGADFGCKLNTVQHPPIACETSNHNDGGVILPFRSLPWFILVMK